MKRKKPTHENINQMKETMMRDMETISKKLHEVAPGDPDLGAAMASIESFTAVSLKVMKGTNASKIRDAMVQVEILARIDGKHIFD